MQGYSVRTELHLLSLGLIPSRFTTRDFLHVRTERTKLSIIRLQRHPGSLPQASDRILRSCDVENVTLLAPESRASSAHGVSSMLPPDLLEQVRRRVGVLALLLFIG